MNLTEAITLLDKMHDSDFGHAMSAAELREAWRTAKRHLPGDPIGDGPVSVRLTVEIANKFVPEVGFKTATRDYVDSPSVGDAVDDFVAVLELAQVQGIEFTITADPTWEF